MSRRLSTTMARPNGFTIAEALIATGILSAVFFGLFFLLDFGIRGYHQALSRTGLVTEVNRIRSQLEADLNLTNYAGVSFLERSFDVDGVDVRRDALSALAVSDWFRSDAVHESTKFPRWDRHVVYTTQTNEDEQLLRLSLEPADLLPLPEAGFPMSPYEGLTPFLSDIPETDIRGVRTLTHNLYEFQVQPDEAELAISVNLILRRSGGLKPTGGGERVEETMQAVMRFVPKNSIAGAAL